MAIIGRAMSGKEQFHYVMWLVSLVTHATFLWFCMQYGLYATKTSPIAAIVCLVDIVLLVATITSHVSFADMGSRVRIFFVAVTPVATVILAFVGDRDSSYNAIYVMGIAFAFMALYFLVDLAFLQGRRAPRRSGDEIDETGSVEALYPKRQDTD